MTSHPPPFLAYLIGALVLASGIACQPANSAPVERAQAPFLAKHFQPEPTEDVERWQWPPQRAFQETFAQEGKTTRLVIGTIVYRHYVGEGAERQLADEVTRHGFMLAIAESGSTAHLLNLTDTEMGYGFQAFLEDGGDYRVLSGFGAASSGELRYENSERVIGVRPTYISPPGPVHARYWEDHVYARTLLATHSQPVYHPVDEDAEDASFFDHSPARLYHAQRVAIEAGMGSAHPEAVARALAAIEELMEIRPPSHSSIWREAIDFAHHHDDDLLARRLYPYYQPVGSCSEDGTPAYIAQNYSETCARIGDLSCVLNLQLQLVQRDFWSLADSSDAEQRYRHDTQVLKRTPIDVDRFLRGAVLQFRADRTLLDTATPWGIGRALALDAEYDFDAWFAMVEDPALDELNRLLATKVIYAAAVSDHRADKGRLLRRFRHANLPRSAQIWVVQMERERRFYTYVYQGAQRVLEVAWKVPGVVYLAVAMAFVVAVIGRRRRVRAPSEKA